MKPEDIQAFREKWRLDLLERLVLRTVLSEPVLAGRLSVTEAQTSLKEWLDRNSSIADASYGRLTNDPALTALYADEVKDLVEKMKARVDKMTGELQKILNET